MNDYASYPTAVLQRMWEFERDRLLQKKDAVISDYDHLLAMRTELDRRKDELKPQAENIDFARDYLTD